MAAPIQHAYIIFPLKYVNFQLICICSIEPSDPTSYILNEVNMREAKEYVKKLNEQ